ncbi:MAG: enoyl-CoA hydratase/isomerase family protein, partial [Actinomycetota bacterium]|nr:enoyl-CoA hydratase/isomerase family protein [Actinomycetota bacterium]
MTDQCEDVGLRFDVDDAVVTITLCRPETGNAQTPRMWATLAEIGESLPSGARVVVLRAEGESFGSVPGAISLADLERLDDRALTETVATFQEAFGWWRRPDVVTIAAVQGHAVGAGFQLALACDLRVLAEDARFAMRETSLGLVPDLGGTQPLVEAIGYSRALEVCVT